MRQSIINRTYQCIRNLSTAKPLTENLSKADASKKNETEYWYKEKLNKKQIVHWNYRREVVDRLNLDNSHSKVWLSIGLSIGLGFFFFIWVKADLLKMRKKQMEKRKRELYEAQLAEEEKYPTL